MTNNPSRTLTLHGHLPFSPICFILVRYAHPFSFQSSAVCLFVFALCAMLPLSLDSPFLIVPLFFFLSNVRPLHIGGNVSSGHFD